MENKKPILLDDPPLEAIPEDIDLGYDMSILEPRKIGESEDGQFQMFLIEQVLKTGDDVEFDSQDLESFEEESSEELDEIIETYMIDYDLSERQARAFRDIELLKPDWNSYGCGVPTPKTIEKAKKLCGFLGYDCEVQPFPMGNIELYCDGVEYDVQEEE